MSVGQNTLEVTEPVAAGAGSVRRRRARPYLILAVIVAAILLAYFAFRAITAGHESTDDAQVGIDMVPISTRVGGTVIAVPVVDHQAVKKGDLLAQIDQAD